MPNKPGRKTNGYTDSIQPKEKLTEHVYVSEAMAGRVRVHTQPKRLEFRVDPSDRATLSTRIDELIDAMADVHRVKRDVLRRRSVRDHDLLFAQQVTWFLLRNRWGLPYEVITAYFDHHRTTIRYGIENCEDAYETDAHFRRYIDLLPFYANVNIDEGRIIALEALFEPKVGKDTAEAVKTQQRARKAAKTGIAEDRED